MTDHPNTLSRYRLPLRRDRLKQAREFTAPAMRYVPKNPLFLIGAALIGVAGFLAWRNRDKIAATAGPMIEDARARGQALMNEAAAKGQSLLDEAAAKGSDLLDEARAKGEAVAETISEKVSSVRRGAAGQTPPTDVH